MSDNAATPYQKFVGRVIACKERKDVIQFMGHDREFTTVEYCEDDPTIQEIKAMVGKGRLRIFTPGRDLGTCDWWPDRINVSIRKDEDGTFKVCDIHIG